MQTSLRSVIGDMGLDDTLASREEIEKLVSNKVCKVCQDWGLTVMGVDLLEIDPTDTIQRAMHEQIRAERYRRTQKVTAEGYAEQVRLEGRKTFFEISFFQANYYHFYSLYHLQSRKYLISHGFLYIIMDSGGKVSSYEGHC